LLKSTYFRPKYVNNVLKHFNYRKDLLYEFENKLETLLEIFSQISSFVSEKKNLNRVAISCSLQDHPNVIMYDNALSVGIEDLELELMDIYEEIEEDLEHLKSYIKYRYVRIINKIENYINNIDCL